MHGIKGYFVVTRCNKILTDGRLLHFHIIIDHFFSCLSSTRVFLDICMTVRRVQCKLIQKREIDVDKRNPIIRHRVYSRLVFFFSSFFFFFWDSKCLFFCSFSSFKNRNKNKTHSKLNFFNTIE